jgi:hypothetical protein
MMRIILVQNQDLCSTMTAFVVGVFSVCRPKDKHACTSSQHTPASAGVVAPLSYAVIQCVRKTNDMKSISSGG